MIDRFTKVVLLVIAICLVILAARTFQTLPVQASKEIARVVVEPLKVDVVAVGGKYITPIMARRIVENLQGRR